MEDLVTPLLSALLGLASFWLAWFLQTRLNAEVTFAGVRGLHRAAADGGASLAAQVIPAVAARARGRRRPVERWLARVQRRAPAPAANGGDAFAVFTSPFARLAVA